MGAIRMAEAVWEGDLMSGAGKVTAKSSGVFKELPVSWSARTEQSEGKTSPEELVAAAHASCYCMALSNGLAKAGKPAKKLEVKVAVTFEKLAAGFRVVSSGITVKGAVPGMDAAAFTTAAESARDGCPISQMMRGNVAISVTPTLAE